MNGGLIGLYGVFLALVAYAGKGGELIEQAKKDAPQFVPVAIGIGVLTLVSKTEQGAKIAGPFAALALIAYTLRNFDSIKGNTLETLKLIGAFDAQKG